MLVTITALRRESGLDQGGGDAGGNVNGGCATTREGSDGAVGGCATTREGTDGAVAGCATTRAERS